MFTINKKKLYLLKCAVEFFQNYGNEKYNCEFDLDWYSIYLNIIANEIYYTYKEFEDLKNYLNDTCVYDESIIKEKGIIFFNALVKNAESISEFYNFKDDQYKTKIKLNESVKRTETQKDLFNRYACYKCKYFHDYVTCTADGSFSITIQNLMRLENLNLNEIKKLYFIDHHANCLKRKALLEEIQRKDSYPFNKEQRFNEVIDKLDEMESFKFEKNDNVYNKTWSLKLVEKCKHFENSNITFKEFIDKYVDIYK